MHEDLKEEEIVNKVGGRFKLSALIQKRLVALNQGAKPLVHVPGGDRMTIVIEEIMQDKIFLDVTGNLNTGNVTSMANITGTALGSMGPQTFPMGGSRPGEND